MRALTAVLTLLAALLALPRHAQESGPATVTVFAAASLTEAFKALGTAFESSHPGTHVAFNFAGSQQLVQQLAQGAKADLFASADRKQMSIAIASHLVETASVGIFARNRLVVIVPGNNPGTIRTWADLEKAGLKIILADSAVPAGRYALQFLDRVSGTEGRAHFRASVLGSVVSWEENVRAVLAKVELGECDAGIVYTSDAARDTSGDLFRVGIPDSLNVIAEYPIAALNGASAPAREFAAYLLSREGGAVLERFGFIPPRNPPGR